MSAQPDDFDVATRYLRGELDEIDRAVFEERMLGDDEVHQLVRAAEDELLDAHAAGTLDAATRARLDARLAAEPELRRRRVLAGGLFRRAARSDAAGTGAAVTPITAGRSRRRVMRWAAPAMVAIAAAALVLFYLARAPVPAPEVVTVAMAAPTRGSEVPEIKLVVGTRTLRLVLDVPAAPPPAVSVTGPRGPVRHAVGAPSPDGLVLDLDAAAVVPGLHDVTVLAAGAPAVTFQLRVVR